MINSTSIEEMNPLVYFIISPLIGALAKAIRISKIHVYYNQ